MSKRAGPAAPSVAVLNSGNSRQWLRAGLAVATIGWGAQEFTPLLLLYQAKLNLSATTTQATFVPYVIGLFPGLLFGGPFSDRLGRRRTMAPTIAVSALATTLLMLGANDVGWIMAGRLLAGMASGAGFSCGAAWIRELSTMDSLPSAPNPAPRRLTVATTIGFGLGPLVSGVIAQWLPLPTLSPYLPHLLLALAAFPLVLGTTETVNTTCRSSFTEHLMIGAARDRRFLSVVIPLAPWVFIPVAVAVGYLPGLVKAQISAFPLIFSALATAANAIAGIAVQPMARRADKPGRPTLFTAALALVTGGMVVAALAAAIQQPLLVLVAALVLGAGYGCCQVCGLLEVQRMAQPDHLAGLTAVYQAVSYIGFTASYPLAAIGRFVPAVTLLLAVAMLAAITLIWTSRAAVRTSTA